MDLQRQLFEGEHIRLGSLDHEKDPEIISRWTHNPLYLRMLGPEPARPKSPAKVKKMYESLEKEMEESKNMFHFTLQLRGEGEAEDRLIGFARLYWIEWNHGTGWVQLGIGDPEDWGKGYGSEALDLLLHYAFRELNLYHLSGSIPEYNEAAQRLFTKKGFVEEIRRREALARDGRRWDMLHFGLLKDEWRGLA